MKKIISKNSCYLFTTSYEDLTENIFLQANTEYDFEDEVADKLLKNPDIELVEELNIEHQN